MADFELTSAPRRVRRKRLNKAPEPRFKADISGQLDAVAGCPEAFVPENHLARSIRSILQQIDFSSQERKYSSQGRHGYHPRHVVGALVYGSLVGVHESTKLARLLKTDAAARLVSGGHAISAGRLRAYRRENEVFFSDAIQQTLKLAQQRGLLKPEELAIDSVRLRADASQKAGRILSRSKKRLAELAAVDVKSLDADARAAHEQKVEKHRASIRLCTEQQRASVVTTSPSAGVMQFPSGGAAPGHRVTVVATGVRARLILDVLVDSSNSDFGKFGPAMLRAREALKAAGVPLDNRMQVAADPGYFTREDLAFALNNKHWLDSLIDERRRHGTAQLPVEGAFTLDDFRRGADNSMTCPAGRRMLGPSSAGQDLLRRVGDGCSTCGLKGKCTKARRRVVCLNVTSEIAREHMLRRMEQPDARPRYHQRMATVEPVFSVLEDEMGFRRVNSRKEIAVRAEILLKVFAYNVRRLIDAKRRLRHVRMFVAHDVPLALPRAA